MISQPRKLICYEDKYLCCPQCKSMVAWKWKKYNTETTPSSEIPKV